MFPPWLWSSQSCDSAVSSLLPRIGLDGRSLWRRRAAGAQARASTAIVRLFQRARRLHFSLVTYFSADAANRREAEAVSKRPFRGAVAVHIIAVQVLVSWLGWYIDCMYVISDSCRWIESIRMNSTSDKPLVAPIDIIMVTYNQLTLIRDITVSSCSFHCASAVLPDWWLDRRIPSQIREGSCR